MNLMKHPTIMVTLYSIRLALLFTLLVQLQDAHGLPLSADCPDGVAYNKACESACVQQWI